MHMLYDLIPVLLFFVTFKLYGIYVATQVGIAATAIQVLLTRFVKKKWDRMQCVTLVAFVLFGGMTLYFHDPLFVKWKPTVVFWIFALVILFTQFFTHKSLMQRFMEPSLAEKGGTVPMRIWRRLNLFWALFFFTLGSVNVYVAYALSDDAWVNFKFYGITSALLVFAILQAAYLMRYVTEDEDERN